MRPWVDLVLDPVESSFGKAENLTQRATTALKDARALVQKRRNGGGVSQAEIQDDVQRFSGLLLSRLAQAMQPLVSAPSPAVREVALRRQLNYLAAVFDIASGPLPEVSALDMFVFVRLCRVALERFWIPEVFGEAGRPLAQELARSEVDLDPILAKVLKPSERHDLDLLVEDWLLDNPGQAVVESVRLDSFSERVGRAAADHGIRVRGLMASVRSATRSADQAVMLGERAIFLAQRLPFVIRLHARLVAHELVGDAVTTLKSIVGGRRFLRAAAAFATVGLGLGVLLGRRLRRR